MKNRIFFPKFKYPLEDSWQIIQLKVPLSDSLHLQEWFLGVVWMLFVFQ